MWIILQRSMLSNEKTIVETIIRTTVQRGVRDLHSILFQKACGQNVARFCINMRLCCWKHLSSAAFQTWAALPELACQLSVTSAPFHPLWRTPAARVWAEVTPTSSTAQWGQLRNDCFMLCMSAECFCFDGLLTFFKSEENGRTKLVKCPRDVFYDQKSVLQLLSSALKTPSGCSADTFAHDTAHYCPQVATMS